MTAAMAERATRRGKTRHGAVIPGAHGAAHIRRLAGLPLLGLLFALAACSGASPSVPAAAGGTYTSQRYHFSVTYPSGWKATVGQQSSSIVPLTLVITHIHASTTQGAAVSTFTITIFDAHDSNIAQSIKALAGDKTLTHATIAGMPAYQGAPIQQPAQDGAGGQVNDVHTDYYLPASDYEYQLSTDAISGDSADSALSSMLAGFKLLK